MAKEGTIRTLDDSAPITRIMVLGNVNSHYVVGEKVRDLLSTTGGGKEIKYIQKTGQAEYKITYGDETYDVFSNVPLMARFNATRTTKCTRCGTAIAPEAVIQHDGSPYCHDCISAVRKKKE